MALPVTRLAVATLVALILFSSTAEATSFTEIKLLVPRTNSTGPGPNDYACESARGPDFYGIGVRLGIYFTWVTAWVANVWMPGEVAGAQDANAVFLFVNIVSLVRCAITFTLTQLDTLIMMHLSSGFLFSVLSTWRYRTCGYTAEGHKAIRHWGGFGTHFRLGLSLAISIFGLWFWLYAIRLDVDALYVDDGPCATVYTFMFAKVRATGGVRIFYIIMCLGCSIYFGIMLLVSSLAAYARTAKIITLIRLRKFRTTSRLRYATGLKQKQLRFIFKFLRIGNFIYMIWSMVLVECTLNFNHVKSVLGPGGRIYFPSQLIPLLIGVFSFARLLYKLIEQLRDPDDNPSLPSSLPISGTEQEMPHGRKVFKLFAPPTGFAKPHGSPHDIPPEDDDIDSMLEGESAWVRYLVSWLPWLSLLWQKDDFRMLKNRQNGQEREKNAGATTGSEASTRVGSPTTPLQRPSSKQSMEHHNNPGGGNGSENNV